MKTSVKNMDAWTTEELLKEVLDRSAGDRSALDHIQTTAVRALLNDCDQKSDTATLTATGDTGRSLLDQGHESL